MYFFQSSVPSDSPTVVTATATSPVSIITRWGHVPCIDRNSDITKYTVRYSAGGKIEMDEFVYGTGESERTHTATLLVPNTSYSIQVAAVTNAGITGPFSTNITVKMSPPRGESVRYPWLRTFVQALVATVPNDIPQSE